MNKILRNNSRKVGAVLAEIDANFLAVCKAMIKLANPDLELKNYADNASEPVAPTENDCYLVIDAGTIWALECEKYDIIVRTATGWELSDHNLTELNAMLQSNFFKAENIAITTPANMMATTVQEALEEFAAVVFP